MCDKQLLWPLNLCHFPISRPVSRTHQPRLSFWLKVFFSQLLYHIIGLPRSGNNFHFSLHESRQCFMAACIRICGMKKRLHTVRRRSGSHFAWRLLSFLAPLFLIRFYYKANQHRTSDFEDIFKLIASCWYLNYHLAIGPAYPAYPDWNSALLFARCRFA